MALAPGDKAVRVKLSDGYGAYPCSPVLDVGNRAVRVGVSGGVTAVKASLRNVAGGYRIPAKVSDIETRAAVNLKWTDYWYEGVDCPGGTRRWGCAAGAGSKVFAGLGEDNTLTKLADWRAFDALSNTWEARADFPGTLRTEAACACCGDSIYVIAGQGTGLYSALKDVWVYSISANSWTQQSDFPGDARTGASAVCVGSTILLGRGWLGLGYGGGAGVYLNDWWALDTSTGEWTQLWDEDDWDVWGDWYMGRGYLGVAVEYDSRVYWGLGADYYGTKDYWFEFDPAGPSMTQKTSYAAALYGSVAARLNNRIYVGTGSTGSSAPTRRWEAFSPSANAWTAKPAFANDTSGLQRLGAVAAPCRGRIFVATGWNGYSVSFDDTWIYDPAGVPWGIV